jgi:tRNA pseudouridine38-40 synthase
MAGINSVQNFLQTTQNFILTINLQPMRYFLDLSYRGTQYHGWQIQANAHSVQQELQSALSVLLGQETACYGSGRTDTGVHATQQVAHFDIDVEIAPELVVYKLNKMLPKDISVQSVRPVLADAHARFDAFLRSYQYRLNKRKSPFIIDLSYYWPFPLDIATMNEAAVLLLGTHDFQAFSKVKTDVESFECDISKAIWSEDNDYFTFDVSANRFLRGMVRALVGTLMEVGQGRISAADFGKIIESKSRKSAGRAVPACGLFLTEVRYPSGLYI